MTYQKPNHSKRRNNIFFLYNIGEKMASSAIYLAFAVVLIIIAIAIYVVSSVGSSSVMHTLSVQITDPPKVPQGTNALLVSYSSVQVHTSGTNQSGWVSAQGSGTLNMTALINTTETIANAQIAANSTINLI